MTTTYTATGNNHRVIDADNDLTALVARVKARANADDQSGATPHYVITPWTDGVEGDWRDEIHVYADHNGEPNPNNTPLPVVPEPLTITAESMIYAQGVRLTADQSAALTTRADEMREITGTTAPKRVVIPVYNGAGVLIGYMRYER